MVLLCCIERTINGTISINRPSRSNRHADTSPTDAYYSCDRYADTSATDGDPYPHADANPTDGDYCSDGYAKPNADDRSSSFDRADR